MAMHDRDMPPQRKRRTSQRLPGWLAAAVVTAAAVAGGTFFLAVRDVAGPAASQGGLPPLDYEPGVVHVHGLGVDPADGMLYAATHSGLFRLPEKEQPVRVANRAQDTMGFAIVGPRTFVGSGHPDFREDDVRPPLLGLIESSDAGETWTRRSLHGEADFHVLRVVHGQVYGYDSTSGTFMVTKDRKQWDRRSRLAMRDFVVSPVSPDVMVATTEQGLARSGDGGRSWQVVTSAPPLVVVAWEANESLYGVAPDGTVHRSEDAGATWTRRGNAGGEPAAFAVDRRGVSDVLYVALHERGIVASTDGGMTFTFRYTQPAGG